MPPVFLMSYPGPTWRIRGGENFRSEGRRPTSPRRALTEWLTLADAVELAGGRVLVMPPPPADPPLSGLLYTANIGDLFSSSDGPRFLVAQMTVAHRRAESEVVRTFVRDRLGLATVDAAVPWEGQAELQRLGERLIATWGVRSDRASVDRVRELAPPGSSLYEIEIRAPFFHGDTCLNPIPTPSGATLLLAFEGALVGADLAALGRFLGPAVELLPIDRDDALAYACNALPVAGTLLAPAGLSPALRAALSRSGLAVVELALDELFGKGGGGPRCLVNELRGFAPAEGPADYATQRATLHSLIESYPNES